MCGIFGYIGKEKNAGEIIVNGLKRLEYRGYDSWGIAVLEEDTISVTKKTGQIGTVHQTQDFPKSHIGVGHTRWATHGGVSDLNAHPHFSSDQSFVLAQNGVVENYLELKEKLITQGYEFVSQTDTEIIVRLIESKLKINNDLVEATKLAFYELEGRNTIIVLSKAENKIIAIREGSPLVLGIGEKEIFIASDTLSFADKTNKVVYLDNSDMVVADEEKFEVQNIIKNEPKEIFIQELDYEEVEIDLDGHDHFMIKEIIEQKNTIKEVVNIENIEEYEKLLISIKEAGQVYLVGAGTASYAASQVAFFLRKYANIKAIELKSYEIESYANIFGKEDLMIAISQSGETSDTIEAVEIAKSKGVKIVSLVNMVGSTLSRISDLEFYSKSGPEICVASTKAFTSQITWGLHIAMSLIDKRHQIDSKIKNLSNDLQSFFTEELFLKIKKIVKSIADKQHFFVLGKGQNFYISLEAALKIKEITYKHIEGFAAGELKHGVIALIEKDTPVFAIVSEDQNEKDMITSVAEVKARGAKVIGIARKENPLFDDTVLLPNYDELDPIINIIPFQLISYFLGIKLGLSPDKPRNLAKSVTVK